MPARCRGFTSGQVARVASEQSLAFVARRPGGHSCAHMCSNPCTKAHLTCVAQCTIAHASVMCTFLKFCPLDANGVKMFTLFAKIYCNAIDAMIHAYKCASYVLSPLAEILQKSESQLELKSPTQLRPGALHTTPFQGSTPS